MRRLLTVGLVLAGLVAVDEADAQQPRTIVHAQLDAAAHYLGDEGYSDAEIFDRNRLSGLLIEDASAYFEVELEAGVRYVFSGVCDAACDDLDLRLLKIEGLETVTSDVELDDVPLLNFSAPSTGAYLLAVDMAECGENLCYFGVRAFRD